MNSVRVSIFTFLCLLIAEPSSAQTLREQNDKLLNDIEKVHAVSKEGMEKIRTIFASSPFIGQGNPQTTHHPLSSDQCLNNAKEKQLKFDNPEFEKICRGKFMAPLYDPAKEKPEQAKACIDIFEYPDMPCTYPVVWTRAKEAAEICSAMGKRLCDAHEWEGACAGDLQEADYRFDLAKGSATPNAAVQKMRAAHNLIADKNKSWSYGKTKRKGVCGQNSVKDNGCNGGDWKRCGSNTYPSASFAECKSTLGVYDLNGNAAEHMNLPLAENQMASRGSKELGVTEMKGSWFIFDKYEAHADHCRWRAPYWHGSRVMDEASHHNYHLSFRCCKSL